MTCSISEKFITSQRYILLAYAVLTNKKKENLTVAWSTKIVQVSTFAKEFDGIFKMPTAGSIFSSLANKTSG